MGKGSGFIVYPMNCGRDQRTIAGSFAAIENLLVFLESGVASSVLKKHMR